MEYMISEKFNVPKDAEFSSRNSEMKFPYGQKFSQFLLSVRVSDDLSGLFVSGQEIIISF